MDLEARKQFHLHNTGSGEWMGVDAAKSSAAHKATVEAIVLTEEAKQALTIEAARTASEAHVTACTIHDELEKVYREIGNTRKANTHQQRVVRHRKEAEQYRLLWDKLSIKRLRIA